MKTIYFKYTTTLAMLFIAVFSMAQQIPTPAAKQTKSVLIMNATAHIGNGEVIENSAIAFTDGKLTMVADARVIRFDMTKFDTIISAAGMHVYPGFIAANSTLGLVEYDAIRASVDDAETGTFKPSVRSAIAYNADSEIIPTVRSNGVLMAQVVPRGGVISGVSSVMQLDAWNWEDALLREDDGVHLNWPQVFHRHADKGKVSIEKVKTYDQQLREIQIFFSEAKAYCNNKNNTLIEVRFEGVRGVIEGQQTLYVHADDAKSIIEAIRFKKEMGIQKMVIVGGYQAAEVADLLKENNVPVMVQRVHSLPYLKEDDVQLPYKLPAILHKAGVMFCLENSGDMERMGARNIPFHAGTAVAYGLPYEEAVKAITLNAAKILGIDNTCGTLEQGKDATLFISKGDALDMRTNQLTAVFIQGRSIDLGSKQTELYERYMKKYGE
jgi:imidazolonepropionase-like amidohydrolase